MYAFAQRTDTRVVDEPLYAHYLRVSGAHHPGYREVLAAQDPDGDRVIREVVLGPVDGATGDGPPVGRPVVFFKQMAHHLIELDLAFLDRTTHVILTRDPRDMLPSLVNQVPEPTLADTGLARQCELVAMLRERGQDPPILDARELLRDPADVLAQLCERLGLPFEDAMLSWQAGPIAEDGVWAPHWYHNVHRSTGFGPYSEKPGPLASALEAVYADCKPWYETLHASALKPRVNADG